MNGGSCGIPGAGGTSTGGGGGASIGCSIGGPDGALSMTGPVLVRGETLGFGAGGGTGGGVSTATGWATGSGSCGTGGR
jgi:hypothetical protein